MADVSYSSITPSSASYASSVFPVLDASTSDLVDSIVARVAAGASDWKPVLEAYKEEFDARRLDGETDTVVYGLLLRLGMERGTDWRSKWANVKRQQQQQQQHEVAKTPRAPPVDIAKPDVFRRLHDDSAKTPLPSIKQQHGRLPQALTREALDKLQSTSSPYKKSYNTPAAARYAFNDYAAVTPRVHFASSMHEQQSPMTRYDQVIDQPRVNPASTSEGKEAMMHQAIRFDRLVLLGRMMDDWLSRIAVLQKLDIHTELARNALLARRSIHLWQDRVVRHRDLLETAERARQAAVKRSSLNLWREKAEKKQKARWEKQMHLAYRTVARKQEKQLKEAVLSHWFQHLLDTRCAKFRQTSLLRNTLAHWLSRSAQLAEIEAEADVLLEDGKMALLQDCLETWKTKTILLRREASFVEQVDVKLCDAAFNTWRERAYENQVAEEFTAKVSLRSAFARWKARLAYVRSLDSDAAYLHQRAAAALVSMAFHTWKIAEHGKLLLHARKTRLLRRTLAIWRDQTLQRTVSQVSQADSFRRRKEANILASSVKMWKSRLLAREKSSHLASSLSSRLVLQRSFQTWRKARSAHRLEARKAQVAQDFFEQRRCLQTWHKKMKEKKAVTWVEDRRKQTMREALNIWRKGARRSIRDTATVQAVQSAIDQRILLTALRGWTDRVIDIRARELTVSQDRSNLLVSSAFSRWRALTARHAEDLSLVDSFVEVQDEQLGKRYFRRWLTRTRRDRTLKALLQEKLQDDERNLLSGCFEKWTDRYRENELLQEEEQVLAYRQQQALLTMFVRWKGRTMTLPAIRFDSERLRKAAFQAWRAALPGRMDLNRAVTFHDEKLLSVTFSIWDEARRAKAARRAANRFRAFSANGNRLRISPLPVSHGPVRAIPATPDLTRPTPAALPSGSQASPAVVRSHHFARIPLTSTPTKVKQPSSSLVPPFSAARLRQEVFSRSPIASLRQVQPEAIALPPSSSASTVSEASAGAADKAERRRARSRSRSRRASQTDEGILREMRERLAAVGLGEGVKSRGGR